VLAQLGVDVAWHPSSYDADEVLRAHVAAILGRPISEIRGGRLCPTCGSHGHGRPWVSGAYASLSRSGPHLLTAVSVERAVGVDVESVDAVTRHWSPGDVLHRGERADTPAERARTWCAKEALLKLRGTGLLVPMTDVRLEEHQVLELEAPDGFRAALALGVGPNTPSRATGSTDGTGPT
jgi:4'-phosphopantetheinyl transferase